MEKNTKKMPLKTKWLLYTVGSFILITIGLLLFEQSISKSTNKSTFLVSGILLILTGIFGFGQSVLTQSDLNRKKHYEKKKTYRNKRANQKPKPKKNKALD